MAAQKGVNTALTRPGRFSLGRLHMGDLSPPPPYRGQVQGDKALMGGLMRGDIDLIGGT